MRELEFLPAWYPQLRRRRHLLAMEFWIVCMLLAGCALWGFLASRNRRAAEHALELLRGQLRQTNSQLQQMERLEVLRRQWRQQAETLNRLGLHIDSSRLIGKLESLMPGNVSLLELNLEVEESPLAMSNLAKASLKDPSRPPMDRRLKVRLTGVAPTDAELATLLTELNQVPYFEQVVPNYARDQRESGHILRKFEIVFSVNLNSPPES